MSDVDHKLEKLDRQIEALTTIFNDVSREIAVDQVRQEQFIKKSDLDAFETRVIGPIKRQIDSPENGMISLKGRIDRNWLFLKIAGTITLLLAGHALSRIFS